MSAPKLAEAEYVCDCDATDERHDYKVTGHDGSVTICAYCPDCYEMALIDWSGETAKVEAV